MANEVAMPAPEERLKGLKLAIGTIALAAGSFMNVLDT